MIRRFSELKLLFIMAFAVTHLAFFAGCNVGVRGKQRPLIRMTPIEGDVELVAESRDDELKTELGTHKSKVETFEQRLQLRTRGDIYDPRFLTYSTAIGLGLSQQEFESENESFSSDGTLQSYELFANLLKNKTLGLIFNASKSERLVGRQFLGSVRAETESTSFAVPLRLERWPMLFQYSVTDTTQSSSDGAEASVDRSFFSREDKRFHYSVQHRLSRLSNLVFDFERNEVSQRGFGFLTFSKNDFYTLRHDLNFGSDERNRLSSFLNVHDRTEPSERRDVLWREDLRLEHTDNFKTEYKFTFTDLTQKSFGGLNTFKTKRTGLAGSFEHRLYESLITRGGVLFSETKQNSGIETMHKGANIGFGYRKKNPWGKLSSNYYVNFTQLEQVGGSSVGSVVGESHTVPDGPFPEVELDRTGIDVDSIVVEDSNGFSFTEGVDYVIEQDNGKVRINIILNQGMAPDFTSVGQEFFVSYLFTVEPKRTEDAVRQIFSIRQRFKNGFSVFYRHRRRDENISSSVADITPDNFRVNKYGADYVNKGFSAFVERVTREGAAFSSTTDRIGGNYRWFINRDTLGEIYASKNWRTESKLLAQDIELLLAGGSLSSKLSSKYSLTASVRYRDEKNSLLGNKQGIDFTSELRYRYRQLSMSLGLQFDLLDDRGSNRESTFIYFRAKRVF